MWYSIIDWGDGDKEPTVEDKDLWQLMIKLHKWMSDGSVMQDMRKDEKITISIRYIPEFEAVLMEKQITEAMDIWLHEQK